MKYLNLKEIKDVASPGREGIFQQRVSSGAGVRKEYPVEVKELEDGTTEFVITTDSVDRMGDTIAADGWELGSFLKNPVVLFAHDSHSLPVGRAVAVTHTPNGLKSRVQWVPKDVYPFAGTVREMVKGGFLNATSVGFQPLEYKWAEDKERPGGIDFTKQELLEFSIVPIPANAEALVTAREAGIDVTLIKEWAAKWLEQDPARPAEKSAAELAAEAVAATKEENENVEAGGASAKPEDGVKKAAELIARQFVRSDDAAEVVAPTNEVAELKALVEKLQKTVELMAVKVDGLEKNVTKEAVAPAPAPAAKGLTEADVIDVFNKVLRERENRKRGRLPEDF